ncbi:Transcriptional regulator, Cro/CI family protein [Shewanella benthica]|uniref:Transcriptional regulator, Cro/CI family protein n=2 Tax=Shewanella benthica TaxID=43661 RepID=A0A330M0C5_9GAMM|nr:helix-turn-helix transcriptional regulator [Shewanella benthica]EDP99911.1 transcriptional regulator, Cro/CI family protein [Shewanella benthica KT99]SQH76016.1 Transcriptional regulator, Cro/CI family protein [Shewanella benthica]
MKNSFTPLAVKVKPSGRKKLISKSKRMQPTEKDELMLSVCQSMLLGEITTGGALKKLRIQMLSINQDQYARMVGVTRKIISEIEGDKSKASASVLNQVLRGVGLSVMVMPRDKYLQEQLIQTEKQVLDNLIAIKS